MIKQKKKNKTKAAEFIYMLKKWKKKERGKKGKREKKKVRKKY